MDDPLFWTKVAIGGPNDCWEWTGYRMKHGHGQLRRSKRGTMLTHRYAWELTNGPIPANSYVCHHCDNPPCCNPYHLFLGDQLANMTDCIMKGRMQKPDGRWHSAKLTIGEVREIKRLLGSTSKRAIARQFDVTDMTIFKIATEQTWNWI